MICIPISKKAIDFVLTKDALFFLEYYQGNSNDGGYYSEKEINNDFSSYSLENSCFASKSPHLENQLKEMGYYIKEWVKEPDPRDFDIYGPFDAADRYFEAKKSYDNLPEDYLILL